MEMCRLLRYHASRQLYPRLLGTMCNDIAQCDNIKLLPCFTHAGCNGDGPPALVPGTSPPAPPSAGHHVQRHRAVRQYQGHAGRPYQQGH
eukprot:1160869-Pelagomonas_calceolata.AAC.1